MTRRHSALELPAPSRSGSIARRAACVAALGALLASCKSDADTAPASTTPLTTPPATEGWCGDGELGDDEACDDGNTMDGDGCSGACVEESCGDGVVQPALGEECDDGANIAQDGCNEVCLDEYCGDGVLQDRLDEQCDDGNEVAEDGCSDLCVEEYCGDSVVQAGLGEECDDGALLDEDGCSSACVEEYCGDGVTQPALGEQCDDGNKDPDDECDNACHIVENECPEAPAVRVVDITEVACAAGLWEFRAIAEGPVTGATVTIFQSGVPVDAAWGEEHVMSVGAECAIDLDLDVVASVGDVVFGASTLFQCDDTEHGRLATLTFMVTATDAGGGSHCMAWGHDPSWSGYPWYNLDYTDFSACDRLP